MTENTAVVLGAGGHAKVVIEAVLESGVCKLVGLLDPAPALKNTRVLGIPVLGGDERLPVLFASGVRRFLLGVGGIGDTRPRQQLFELARRSGMQPVSVIHPRAVVSPSATVGPGATVLAGAVINAHAVLGENVLINTGAIIEHDVAVGDHSHVATGARVTGGVRIGVGVHIGAAATVRQCLVIGDQAIVGAGAVVVKDVPAHALVAGVPARRLRRPRIGTARKR